MRLSDSTRQHRETLSPGLDPTLAATDPELVEIFANWAMGEIVDDVPIDPKLRILVQLAALVACHAVTEYKLMLGAAFDAGVTPVEIRELVYQAVPYAGMGRVFDVLNATNAVLAARGVSLPLEPQGTTNCATREAQGRAIQSKLFEAGIERAVADAPADQRHMQRYLSANCFGDFITRRGLDLKTRELLTLSMLAALGGCEPQLAAHVHGNLAAGNDRTMLVAAISHLIPFIGYPRALNALRVITEHTT